ncbi:MULTISPECIES: hypothetical protein [unclassified Bradyrhizobium]|uniref:hypothetical protein n=1 Tax=unclassified Bradyrhizobium TaxID=2631580 RepID=UPI002916D5CF|nr:MULTISPECIES: hypothetical protein [unclassified Bradyrhizobium]
MAKNAEYFGRGSVGLLESLDGDEDIASLIRTTRGSSRSTPRSTDRSRRYESEDGYDEMDFA